MKRILTVLAALITTASAHPGHPGHEDWPFDDFSWSLTAAIATAVIVIGFVIAKRSQRS